MGPVGCLSLWFRIIWALLNMRICDIIDHKGQHGNIFRTIIVRGPDFQSGNQDTSHMYRGQKGDVRG